MSDMTTLSHEYAVSADFAREFNDAVLRLKKWHFAGADPSGPPAEDVREARQRLAQVLRDVAARLAANAETSRTSESVIPGEVIDRLVAKHKNRMSYFIQDLNDAAGRLAGEGEVDPPVIAALDEVCAAADASASASFRRLRRR